MSLFITIRVPSTRLEVNLQFLPRLSNFLSSVPNELVVIGEYFYEIRTLRCTEDTRVAVWNRRVKVVS